MTTIAQERIDTVVRNIISGDNVCGTLANAVQKRDADYFRRAVAPVIRVYEEEAAAIRRQRDAASADAEGKRQTLEMVASNLAIHNPDVKAAVERALGRRL